MFERVRPFVAILKFVGESPSWSKALGFDPSIFAGSNPASLAIYTGYEMIDNDNLLQIERLLIDAVHQVDKAKLAQSIASTPFCGTNDIRDTNILMCSEDYKDRLKAEHDQLLIRVNKLRNMLDQYRQNKLSFTPSCSYDLLHEQLVYMEQYLRVVQKRLVIEGVL